MAILHGTWRLQNQGSYLFIWGETWRRVTPSQAPQLEGAQPNPLAMTPAELAEFLKSLQQTGPLKGPLKGNLSWSLPAGAVPKTEKGKKQKAKPETALSSVWKSQDIALPTHIPEPPGSPYPAHSAAAPALEDIPPAYLYPWRVEGLCLDAPEAMKFLQALPLGAGGAADAPTQEKFVGADLRFWSHVARWSLDLLARSKFLPALELQEDGSAAAIWQPLLDSATDRERLERYALQMPPAARTYCAANSPHPAVDLPPSPQELLRGVLSTLTDAQVRKVAGALTPETGLKAALNVPVREWLHALGAGGAGLPVKALWALELLETALQTWTEPVQRQMAGQNQFRTGFYVRPPKEGKTDWKLEYYLQAADSSDFLVSAKTVWSNPVERLSYLGRTIEQPQETLLSGLGLASKIYPPIEASLNQASPEFCSITPVQAYEFLKTVAWRFQDSGLGVIMPATLANREGWANRLGLSIRAETPKLKASDRLGLQSLLNFKWELTIGGQRISQAEFNRLVALNSPLVEINGEWVELRQQDVRAAQEFFKGRKDKMALSLEDALRLATGDTQTIEKLPVVNFEAGGALQELFSNLMDSRAVEPIPAPQSFRGELRPYQARGAGWLAFLERWGLGACLADDMGLGKSIETIAFLLHLQEQDVLEAPVLLVCPTSVLGNWQREVKKFGPTLKVLLHYGDKRAKGKAFAKAISGKDLVITSYPLLQRDAKDLQSVSWQGVVVDEAQNIKNPEAKQSQAARQLQAQFRIALTGTPVENRLQELWSILDFLNPGYLGARQFFQRRFGIPIEKYGDTASLQTLRSLVQPFILRRLKTDREIIQDLPEKQEMTVFCGLAAEQAQLYQKTVEASLAEIESAEGLQRRGMILALLVKLKQICNHPAQFLKESALGAAHRSGKLQRLEEMLEEVLLEGDRALIFTQFAEWGKLLKPHLERELGREVLFLYGSTRQQDREAMIDRFQHDPQGPPIMILSLKAGGTGLNLTRANHVFHFDRWWNPAVENQATDRVFRIGQTRNVQVHKFVCTGTLEEKIHDMIESKKALAEQVVGAGEQWLTELDTDGLRNLLLLDRNAVIDEE
ncbi:DEAD/DEAH box helicase [Kamptonema formosum]|uniref:DEAD/DEAH box helicase n=1 Tax=Kamptonema formosum TaxID=331992 RepID=UPI0003490DE1|nr:DEAD/DEAH box helicase [Oscillatoria sp. PCC 10802]